MYNHWKVKLFCAVAGLGLFVGICTVLMLHFDPLKEQTFGGGLVSVDRNGIDAIGSAASSSILTGSYVSSTRMKVLGLDKLVVAGSYTPRSFAPTLYLMVERSIDNGQTYYPYALTTNLDSRINVGTGAFATSSAGVPFQIPGSTSASSTSGTAMTFSFSLPYPFTADYMRLSVKEQTTSTFGLVNVQLMGTN